MLEALYYEKSGDKKVFCLLCPRKCKIKDGGRGVCRVRFNLDGIFYTENENLSALALDPIEKKPLYHFYPGKKILSAGGSGCNLFCSFCQNWQISQSANENRIKMTPRELADKAQEMVKLGNIGLAYTYSEPIVMFEYVLEAAKLIKEAGLKNIFISNGYIESDPLTQLLPLIDAFNIDIKAFTNKAYKKNFKADFDLIKKNLQSIIEAEKHLEISCLIVPGINDIMVDAEEFFAWLGGLSAQIPVHINRYFPSYQATMPPTEREILEGIKEAADRHMKNVYLGNIY